MTRRTRKNNRSKKNKVIQKNLVRNIVVILILIVFLFVIYRFNFSSKSELAETVKINFKEFGENIALEEQEVDIEVLTDFDGIKYILLPEKINGYFVQQYYITNLEEDSNTNSSTVSDNTNTLLENIVLETTTIDEVAGLKKYYLTSQKIDSELDEENKIESDDNEQTENNTNANIVENIDDITNDVNKVIEDKNIENIKNEDDINDNNITQDDLNQNNDIVPIENETIDNKDNEIIDEPYLNNDENSQAEPSVVKPGTRYNVSETDEKGKYTLKNIAIEVEYQTITNEDIKLYNQELLFKDDNSKISVTGYIPIGYQLDCTREDSKALENEINEYEDLKDYQMLCVYDINVQKDGNVYQPEMYEWAPSLSVNITSIDLNTLQGESNVKLIHFAENELETIQNFEMNSNSVEFAASSFSKYAVISQKSITEEVVTINTFESDKNYYFGKNYTDNKDGENSGKYSEDKLAKVTINYHSKPDKNFKNENATHEEKYNLKVTSGSMIPGEAKNKPIIPYTLKLDDSIVLENNWDIKVEFKIRDGIQYVIRNNASESYITNEKGTEITLSSKDYQLNNNELTVNVIVERLDSPNKPIISNITSVTANLIEYKTYSYEYKIMDDKTGYVSADEKQNLIRYEKCIPINDQNEIEFDLIDNPFMDRPVGKIIETYSDSEPVEIETLFGFNGWVGKEGTSYIIKKDSDTYLQTLTTQIEDKNNIVIDLYVDWIPANVVFVQNNGTGTGTTSNEPTNTWSNAIEKLKENRKNASNASDREVNIIVVTGELRDDGNAFSTQEMPYTITSLYDGIDYRITQNASVEVNNDIQLSNDLQLDYLNIVGAEKYMYSFSSNELVSGSKYLNANSCNLRIGRGMVPLNYNEYNENTTTFSQIQCGGKNGKNSRAVIESGRYSNIYADRASQNGTNEYNTNITIILGCDYDNIDNNNDNLKVYRRVVSRSNTAKISSLDNQKPIYDIYVKSGTIGIDCFETNNKGEASYSGIYVGGLGSTTESQRDYDVGERRLTIEGGKIANIIGGLKAYGNDKNSTSTYIYVKGDKSSIQCIIGGCIKYKTSSDRVIQVTGGTIQYSIFSGSNGKESSSSESGNLDGNTLLYIGGNAVVGGSEENRIKPMTESNKQSLYGVQYGNVLGAGNGNSDVTTAGVATSTHIIIDGNGLVTNVTNNVYGGGNFAGVYGNTKIDMFGGTVGGTIHGGSNNSGTIKGNSTVNIFGGTIKGNVSDEEAIVEEGSTKEAEAIFAGGYGLPTVIDGNTYINISNHEDVNIIGNIYGGSAMGRVEGSATVEIEKTSNEKIIDISGKLFGAGKGAEKNIARNNGDIKVSIEGGSYPNLEVFGGANISGYVVGNVLVEIGLEKNTSVNKVYGGGNEAVLQSASSTRYTDKINLGKYATVTDAVFNGGTKQGIADNFDSEINVVGSNIKNLYGGSYDGGNLKETHIYVSENANIENIYGAGFGETTSVSGNTNLEIINSTVTGTIYGGGNNGKTSGSTFISIKDNSTIGEIYGGGLGEAAVVENNTKIEISNSTIDKVYGGGKAANVNKNTEISLINSTITEDVYGAGEGNNATVKGNTNVNLNRSTIQNNVFGGGDLGAVEGSTLVRLTSSTVNGSAFAAGNGRVEENGELALVKGSTLIIAEENTNIGESIYGGGNAANVGKTGVSETDTTYMENSNTEVYISGATIGTSEKEGRIIGNVYGGSNRSRIYGNANIYIGQKAVEKGYEKGNIEIKGTVYGGGESVTGGENFNYDFKSVNGEIKINIDGTEYDQLNEEVYTNTININGSIFGSGNASSAAKSGEITIKAYGTNDNRKDVISVQRAGKVEISNSIIKLLGTTDSTNAYSDRNYTLNHIDNLSIKDSTTLYLRYGANLLGSFSSLREDNEPVVVEIDETSHEIKNRDVDNRIYMYSGEILNISKSSENIIDSAGEVKGMTFFGLYVEDSEGNPYSGVFDSNYEIGKAPTWEERQFERTYVLGLHATDHDITKDGFYTVFEELTNESKAHEEDGTSSKDNYYAITSYVNYINPTPEDQHHYMWYTGFSRKVINIPVELIASRYSTFGTKEISLVGVEEYPNATLTLESFNISNDWDENIVLVDKNNINHVAHDENIANTQFGLGMKTGNNGWTSDAGTDFLLTKDNYEKGEFGVKNDFIKGETYKGDDTYFLENLKSTTPSLGFYLYNANTISLPNNTTIGTYKLKMKLTYTEAQSVINADVIIRITIKVSNVDGENIDGYNASITPGIKYELFTRTPTEITSKSSFSAIFELAQPKFKEKIYDETEFRKLYRVIDTGYSLPENTTITMIDKSKDNPKYYYYIVTERDVDKTTYNLEDFIAMGTNNNNEKYNETEMNNIYYDSEHDYEYECFIFIVNFENSKFTDEEQAKEKITTNPQIKIELRAIGKNVTDISYKRISGIIGSQQAEEGRMQYNIYNVESSIDPTATINSPIIYLGSTNTLTVDTVFSTSVADNTRIYNTQYFDRKLGAKITFHKVNQDGTTTQVTDSELSGLYFQINKNKYYPKADGTTRLKMTEIVSNTSVPIIINAENSSLKTGEYIILIETFGSADGIYYGTELDSLPQCRINVSVVSNEYGLKSTIPENQVIIDSKTGCTLDSNGYVSKDLNNLDVNLKYKYFVANPYITVSLERRKYDEEYSLEYQAKDIKLTDYIESNYYVESNLEDEKELTEVTDIWGEFKEYEERPRRSYRTEYEVLSIEDTKTVPATGDEDTCDITLNYKIKQEAPLITGTYKLIFTLYDKSDDNYQYIGEVYSYIIIK